MMKSQIFVDEKTGNVYNLVPEKSWDIAAATFSIIYLVVMLGVFSVLLFAILSNQYLQEDNPIYKLMAYTVIGGGLGGIINGIRSLRYIWKYITLPLLGAVLAAMVYAFFRSGFVAFGGNFAPDDNFANQTFGAFSIGALSGYGSHRVLKWLEEQVNKLFKLTATVGINASDLKDKTEEETKALL
ncbi:MAG: hypothetical protein ACYSU5_13585 [Planctomycetota bacterium]|jgi:hypothetical protein